MKGRGFLGLGLGSMGTVLYTQCTQAQPTTRQTLSQPLITKYTSNNGLLEINFQANYSRVNLGGQSAYLMNYNGQVPGPKLEAKPGDTVRIHLSNNLSQPTNLHYHGLHISPTGNGDNVFLSIPPQPTKNITIT